MTIQVQRNGDAGMTQALSYGLGAYALLQVQRSHGVAQVMESDSLRVIRKYRIVGQRSESCIIGF